MYKKFLTLIIVLAMVSCSYGDYLLASWENDLGGWGFDSVDGWAPQFSNAHGVTDGDYSLRVNWEYGNDTETGFENDWGQIQGPDFDLFQLVALQDPQYNALALDVTTLMTQAQMVNWKYWAEGDPTDPPPSWLNVAICVNNSAGFHWQFVDVASESGQYETTTVLLNYGTQGVDEGWFDYATGWAQVFIAINAGSAGYLYFDNLRLVPEPATIALLGLGGLALIRKRR